MTRPTASVSVSSTDVLIAMLSSDLRGAGGGGGLPEASGSSVRLPISARAGSEAEPPALAPLELDDLLAQLEREADAG